MLAPVSIAPRSASQLQPLLPLPTIHIDGLNLLIGSKHHLSTGLVRKSRKLGEKSLSILKVVDVSLPFLRLNQLNADL